MNPATIEAYAAGAGALSAAIRGLTPEDMTAHPGPGAWSIHELVVHMMDSDMVCAHRMRRIIAEEKPLLIGYDESLFIQRLHYEKTDVHAAAEIFRLTREVMSGTLRLLPAEAFDRVGVHNERGLISLREMVEMYVWHLEHHLKFLHDKRARLGKPLAR